MSAGTFAIGGDLEVGRLGFGAMRITGPGIWGEPQDPDECRAVLRRAVELGVTLIDTASAYGPYVSERLIGETLAPYPDDVVVATKAGFVRPGPNRWVADGQPEHLRESCDSSLQLLRLERIDLFQLHRIDSKVPAAEQFGTLADLQREGKIRHIGLSQVSVDDIRAARETIEVVTVQNRFSLSDRTDDEVLAYCEAEGIGFMPWAPLAMGALTESGGPLYRAAQALGATTGQVAIAWLLRRSPVMLPIPGTSTVAHLEENVAAGDLELPDDVVEELSAAT
jgi:aryl-alcohol dehydrogenase-like predicted oxidoreductase